MVWSKLRALEHYTCHVPAQHAYLNKVWCHINIEGGGIYIKDEIKYGDTTCCDPA